MQTTETETTLACEHCAREFTKATAEKASAALRLHIARTHTNTIRTARGPRLVLPPGQVFAATCPVCQKVFTNDKHHSKLRTRLKLHIRNVHRASVLPFEIITSPRHEPPPQLDNSPQLVDGFWVQNCPVCQKKISASRRGHFKGNFNRHVTQCVARNNGSTKSPPSSTIHHPPSTPSPTSHTPREGKRRQIHWTDQEIDMVVQRAAEMRRVEIDLPLLPIVIQAQEVLEPHRQRHIVGWNTLPKDLKTKIKVRMDVIYKAEIDSIPPQVVTIPIETPIPVDPVAFLASLPTPLLLTEAFTRLTKRLDGFETALAFAVGHKEALAKATPARTGTSMPAPAPNGPPRHPRVAVVGLLKDQFEHLKDKCKDRAVDLVWIDKDQSATRYPAVDEIIVQRFSDHRWSEHAKQVLPCEHVSYISGGIQSVVGKIYDITARQHRNTHQMHKQP